MATHPLQQLVARVAGGVFQHFVEQAGQGLTDVGSGADARGEQVITFDGEVRQGDRIPRVTNGADDVRKAGSGKREAGSVEPLQKGQEVIRIRASLREPFAYRRQVPWIGVLVPPI